LNTQIDKKSIHKLPITEFSGKIEVIQSNKRLAEVIYLLQRETEIGFDTETKPSFKKGVTYPISIIQFATKNHAYLIQLQFTGFPKILGDFLKNDSVKKIGVGLVEDVRKLKKFDKDINSTDFIDLSKLAKHKGITQLGLRSLVAKFLGKRIIKSSQTSNWAVKKLAKKQIKYAATDAWICLELLPFFFDEIK
jgi:ribonuclease D